MMRGRGLRPGLFALVAVGMITLPLARTAAAEEVGEVAKTLAAQNSLLSVAQDDDGSAGGSGSNYWQDHFQLHGFLTTAYAKLDPETKGQPTSSDEQVLGLDSDGTWDYRIAALQLRYDPAPKHTFVVQLSHRKFDSSPLGTVDNDVELDWAFYQYRFTDNFAIKLGKVPVPVGIFNEFRDVGTLLPFFRPAYVFYQEGSFVSETIDGAILVTNLWPNSDWSVDFDAYFGEFDLLESVAANTTNVFEAKATNAIGAQLWLNTPVSGLRAGVGIQQYDVEGSGFHAEKDTWNTWHASVDGAFERFTIRGEYKYFEIPSNNSFLFNGKIKAANYYFQAGFNVTEQLGLWAQQEYSDIDQNNTNLARPARFNNRQDTGYSIVYALRPTIVFKAEYHQSNFELPVGVVVVPTPGGVLLDFVFQEFKSDYSIFSVSFSF